MPCISILISTISFSISCTNATHNKEMPAADTANMDAPVINYAVQHYYPHDTASFTEGLFIHDGQLFESTGSPNELPQTRSLLGIVDLKTGSINKKVELDKTKYFGEGITWLGNKIYQLTYKTKIGFIYDAKTFQKTGEFTYPSSEGWGMTTNGQSLIMTDGTDKLTFISPIDFHVEKVVHVFDNNGAVMNLNELEFINGYIYANVYTTDHIVKIDLTNGKVIGKLDLSSLALEARNKYPGSLEMNGIAYDSMANKVFVTGKMWPDIYAISFTH